MSSLARVRNSESLFKSNICNLFFWAASGHNSGVSVIAGFPQGESSLYLAVLLDEAVYDLKNCAV